MNSSLIEKTHPTRFQSQSHSRRKAKNHNAKNHNAKKHERPAARWSSLFQIQTLIVKTPSQCKQSLLQGCRPKVQKETSNAKKETPESCFLCNRSIPSTFVPKIQNATRHAEVPKQSLHVKQTSHPHQTPSRITPSVPPCLSSFSAYHPSFVNHLHLA